MRGWRVVLVAGAGVLAAVAGTVLAVALNVATGGSARWFPTMERYSLWWTGGATVGVAGAGLLVWAVQRWYDRSLAELVPVVQQPEPWVVDRPAEVSRVVTALRRTGGGTVGITTALQGAGGFGKTTVAKMVRADRRVLRRYRGRIYWVTLGRDAGKEVLVGLVNGLIARLEPDRALPLTDAQQAAEHLAAVLARGPRRLLVLDDVWTEDQLSVFPVAGRCARLVTTRVPSLAAGTAVPVPVDEMSATQALALLVAGLPPLPPPVVAGLVEETGSWPLLLRLVNKILADQAGLHLDVTTAAEELLGRLRAGGGFQVDELTGAAGQQLDVTDPVQRSKAVWATIQASTGLLGPAECERLAELAVFAEDETIPVTLITILWQATSGLDSIAARALCARLTGLALLTPSPDTGTVTMHDVIRDYLRDQLGAARLTQLHGTLIDAMAKSLPSAAAGPRMVTAWWELPEQARYLRENLIGHLVATGRADKAEETATDLRWVDARLRASGPAGPSADLALIGTPRSERLRRVLGQAAHLLAPTHPPYSLTDILYCRVALDPDWGPQAQALAASRQLPALASKRPVPDLPNPSLLRTLTGHTSAVEAVAIAPDGSWLVTASGDHTVGIWDPATGQCRAVLTGHTSAVEAVAIAPDGSWLVSTSWDHTARIWDATTGQQRAVLTGHTHWVTAVAVAPDGTWLATASRDGTARIWDPATGRCRAVLTGHTREVTAVAVAPDGTWLATASYDQTARIWDAATGRCQAVLTGHSRDIKAVAVAPDGTWLATASHDQTARIWDPATGRCRAILTGHTHAVPAIAISSDGTWLATASFDGTARVWDAATGQQRAVLRGHSGDLWAVAVAPDGTWLATASYDQTARIWDAATGRCRAVLTGHSDWLGAVAVAPDGTWLATASGDQKIRTWDPAAGQSEVVPAGRIHRKEAVAAAPDGTWLAAAAADSDRTETASVWDAVSGQQRAVLTGHSGSVVAVAVAPDGTWLATVSSNHFVWIWDPSTGQEYARLKGHHGAVFAVAAAPDGTWLATVGKDETARVWDAATGQQRAVLRGHSGPVNAVAISPDSTWLATASYDQTARIWDPATGRCRAILTGHTLAVPAVAISSDGTWLATASFDGTARVWDAATGQQRAVLRGHSGPVNAVAISPDSTWLATASDHSVRIWNRASGSVSAIMRIEEDIKDCTWGAPSLAVVSHSGLSLFTFNSLSQDPEH